MESQTPTTTRRTLVPDIDPAPVKDRSTLGVIEVTLDVGQTVRAVGLVYGIEHEMTGPGYRANVFLDHYNQRLRVYDYEATDFDALILKLRWLAEANGLDKLLCMAHPDDWEEFLKHGYVLEAILKYFLEGTDAMVVSKFRSQERLTSPNLMQEILLIEDLVARDSGPKDHEPPPGFGFRMAREGDIPGLIDLYRTIFKSYPTPLIHRAYLEHVFQSESLFVVCEHEGRVVAAASAELHPKVHAAELTDCATRTEVRGRGLMSVILHMLEQELRKRRYICAYTMARARSYGMNLVFRELGYEFNGRLLNNCDIFGAYEDMNIWVKDLREDDRAATVARAADTPEAAA